MLINAQDTSKDSTNRKQTQMPLLDQISCLVSVNHHWLAPPKPHKVKQALLIFDC